MHPREASGSAAGTDMRTALKALLAAVLMAASASGLAAPSLSGTKNIVLSNAEGEREVIGSITFTDAGAGKTAFSIQVSDKFGEYFLAMRPFRCLTGARQRLCWFPVRNEPQVISPGDLLPLEYALMFMKTKPAELSVNPFNGVYYKLDWTDRGIRGRVFDVDMEPFINPTSIPLERRVRPVTAADLETADPSSHWLPVMSIE